MDRVYLDADSCSERLSRALARLGIEAILGTEAIADGAPDHAHLSRATLLRCPILTANGADFSRLHTAWARNGQEHSGIVIWAQLPPRSPEAVAEATAGLLSGRAPEDMANSIQRI